MCIFVYTKTLKKRKMKKLNDVYLTTEQFKKDLNSCLTIVQEPTENKKYYVCEHVSYSLHKSLVNVYIK
jgi:hypothetical protein